VPKGRFLEVPPEFLDRVISSPMSTRDPVSLGHLRVKFAVNKETIILCEMNIVGTDGIRPFAAHLSELRQLLFESIPTAPAEPKISTPGSPCRRVRLCVLQLSALTYTSHGTCIRNECGEQSRSVSAFQSNETHEFEDWSPRSA
jgi:hypothetical protein